MESVADLIDAYQAHYSDRHFPLPAYTAALSAVLKKLGKLHHRGEEWWLLNGFVSHSETAPGSAPAKDADGEIPIYTNTVHIRLAPLLEGIDLPE
jgi:hypothetical protein